MDTKITGSLLYDLILCPHRVYLDALGEPSLKASPNPYVELLWERGTSYEKDVISKFNVSFVDLSSTSGDEKELKTTEAMMDGEKLIYAGRITHDNLLGEPDLLECVGGNYVAIDIKSGAADYGREEDFSYKKHYAVQLALYTDILEQRGLSAGHYAYIHDIHGKRVPYRLDEAIGKKNKTSWWEIYKQTLDQAKTILSKEQRTSPALSSICKLCHWYKLCKEQCIQDQDLSLISELGREKRDKLCDEIKTVHEMADINVDDYSHGHRTDFLGIGSALLKKYHNRAKLLIDPKAKPYLTEPVLLHLSDLELFFDIEVDTMKDFTYLHGFIERNNKDNSSEKYIYFWTDEITNQAEEKAFGQAWAYMNERPCNVYYYSPFEKTIYKRLASRYPSVCSVDEVEEFFGSVNVIDLYFQIVFTKTEWPTFDKSIKTLATYLGFKWRDADPSGASSVEWFSKWAETGDPGIKKRILEYNEDDCIATRVLLDGIKSL